MPKVVPYVHGSVIFFAGDKDERIFILQSGTVVLTSEDIVTGKQITEQLNPGDFFGVKSTLAHRPRMETATAKTDVQTVMLTAQEFEKIFSTNKEIISKMLLVFNKHLGELGNKIEKILGYDRSTVKPEDGMIACAKLFHENGMFRSCEDQCNYVLEYFPETAHKEEIKALQNDASIKDAVDKQEGAKVFSTAVAEQSDSEKFAIKQFSLPIFDRFSCDFEDGALIISEFTDVKEFFFLQSGEVSVKKCVNSVIKNLEDIEPGNFFGFRSIILGSKRDVCCVAKGKVKCLKFSMENYNSIVANNHSISSMILKNICKRTYNQTDQLKLLSIKDLNVRIAGFFLMCNDMYGTAPGVVKKSGEISSQRKFPVVVEDVAHCIGVSVNETRDELNKYVSKNRIVIYDTHMIVVNIADMKRTVDSYYANKPDVVPEQQ